MTGHERKEAIVKLLQEDGRVLVAELAERFRVTKVTVRKDLESLEHRGVLERTHGGAVPAEHPGFLRRISDTINDNAQSKDAIAEIAAGLISPSSSILIDSGSTTAYLARRIKHMPLTVSTNSVLVIQELVHSETIEMLVTGGALRRPSMSLMGESARFFLSQLHADILFLGVTGYDWERGMSCTNLIEAETKRSMIKTASKVCLLADSSKAGKRALAHVCGWEDIDVFVTDSIGKDGVEILRNYGVEVMAKQVREVAAVQADGDTGL